MNFSFAASSNDEQSPPSLLAGGGNTVGVPQRQATQNTVTVVPVQQERIRGDEGNPLGDGAPLLPRNAEYWSGGGRNEGGSDEEDSVRITNTFGTTSRGDASSAMQPRRRRSALVTGTKGTYRPVMDENDSAQNRSFTVSGAPRNVSAAYPGYVVHPGQPHDGQVVDATHVFNNNFLLSVGDSGGDALTADEEEGQGSLMCNTTVAHGVHGEGATPFFGNNALAAQSAEEPRTQSAYTLFSPSTNSAVGLRNGGTPSGTSAQQQLHQSGDEDTYAPVQLNRSRSALITGAKGKYKSVVEDSHPLTNRSLFVLYNNGSFSGTTAANQSPSFSGSPANGERGSDAQGSNPNKSVTSLSNPVYLPQPPQRLRTTLIPAVAHVRDAIQGTEGGISNLSDMNDPLNNFQFVIVGADSETDTAEEEENEPYRSVFTSNHAPYGSTGSIASEKSGPLLNAEQAEAIAHNLSKSFAIMQNPSGSRTDGRMGFNTTFSPNRPFDEKPPPSNQLTVDDEDHMLLPIPDYIPCVSKRNLDEDSVPLVAVWQSMKSDVFTKNVLFGARCTLFAIFPAFLLAEHPKTANWFAAGIFLPVWAGLFVRPDTTVGSQVIMTAIAFQAAVVFMVWGVLMNAVGAVNNTSGWWCGVIFGCLLWSMFGDLASKRFMMMYSIILMQMEWAPGGTDLTFPLRFGRDFAFSTLFAFVAVLLPWPTFNCDQARDMMAGLHKLYAAGVGNAMKSYWAPVHVDARMALKQMPFVKIRDLTGKLQGVLRMCMYEPREFNLNRILRGERIEKLQRLNMHLYSMAAAATQRVVETKGIIRAHRRTELKDFEKRFEGPAMALAQEIMNVLAQVGAVIKPVDVTTKVDYGPMCEKAFILSDMINRERAYMMFIKNFSMEDTNSFMRTFAFHTSLLDIASELRDMETAAKEFDESKYPTLLRRAWDFFFYDLWRDFWSELPSRLTLKTARDRRLLKDGFKYSCAFAVACAFTLHYDADNVYFFGMVILERLAQQTASETLNIGVQRCCGLCIGASLAYISEHKTHNLAEETLLSMTFVFVAMCFSRHPLFGNAAQYVVVSSMSGLRLASTPSLLLTRLTDNVFAFISYYIICTVIFPVDPIHVLWNTRTKLFLKFNDLTQSFVALGCAPVTYYGEEGRMLLATAKQQMQAILGLLKEYEAWMPKAGTEPTICGGDYPVGACRDVLLYMTEAASLQATMLDAMGRLHRKRNEEPTMIVRDIMELVRPFILDVGKIVQRYLQLLIDSTETPLEWSVEEALNMLWKAQLACRSMRHVTGKIRRNFFATYQQMTGQDRRGMNVYLNSSMVDAALRDEIDPSIRQNPENEDLIQRMLAMSMHMTKDSALPRDDMQAFNATVTVYELLLSTLSQMLDPMLAIHEYEKSRVV